MVRRLSFLTAVFILVTHFAFADNPKILRFSDIRPGTKAIGFSVFKGVEPQPFDVELRGVTNSGGFYWILAHIYGGPRETLETPLENIGAIAGMSGSPIFVDCNDLDDCTKNGTLVGALSYAVGYFIKTGTNVLLTPAENMLGTHFGGYSATRWFSARQPNKINVSGLEYKNLMLFSGADSLSVKNRLSGGSSGKCGQYPKSNIKPGSMVSVFLARGSWNVGVSGTVTWVDGNLIYVLGHPLFGTGSVNYPFVHVSVADTIQTPYEAYKIIDCHLDTAGTMLMDGRFEIGGIIDQHSRVLPFHVEFHVGEDWIVFDEEIAESPLGESVIRELPVLLAKQVFGDTSFVSMSYQTRIAITDQPEIFMNSIIPVEANAKSPLESVFLRISAVLKKLKESSFDYNLESITTHIDFIKKIWVWEVSQSFLSQKTAVPGETVHVNIFLKEFSSSAVRQISIPVRVPDDFMERTMSEIPPIISVTIQSANKFIDKNSVKKINSLAGLIKNLNESSNRETNVLYVQQVMPLPKSERKANEAKAKSLVKPDWNWTETDQGSLFLFPRDKDIVLSVTPALDHFIDFNATFNITVQPKKNTAEESDAKISSELRKSKKRKWFLLYLF